MKHIYCTESWPRKRGGLPSTKKRPRKRLKDARERKENGLSSCQRCPVNPERLLAEPSQEKIFTWDSSKKHALSGIGGEEERKSLAERIFWEGKRRRVVNWCKYETSASKHPTEGQGISGSEGLVSRHKTGKRVGYGIGGVGGGRTRFLVE